jgi:hypothetical protein
VRQKLGTRLVIAGVILVMGMAMGPATAIVIRHDKAPEQYLATSQDFPPLATFYTQNH